MPTRLRFVFLSLAAMGMLLFPVAASADHGSADEASPNMLHVQNVGTSPEFAPAPGQSTRFNSDLAFWESGAVHGPVDLAAQGNYNGFRLLNIKDPPNASVIRAVRCRSNQGDVSFYQAKNRLLLIQSIDRPVTTDNCATAVDTPVTPGTHPGTGLPGTFFTPGFEGLRIFDVTDPLNPVHIASAPTACGSHTHTTIPDQRDQKAVVYVSSYPVGASVTPTASDFGGPRCTTPHAKISIVEIHDDSPETPIVREQPLHFDTLPFLGTLGSGGTGAVGCHDITAYYHNQAVPPADQSFKGKWQVAGAACLEEGQLWDVSDPDNPTTLTTHSHIRNLFITSGVPGTLKGLWHTASMTWDGEVVLFTDEWAGGANSTPEGCQGPQDTRGNVWFYKMVPPGTEPVPLLGRYMFPRVQPPGDACTLHNGNVIPTNDGYFGVSSAYEAGTSVFDFSGVRGMPEITDPLPGEPGDPVPPLAGREIAFFDAKLDCRTAGPPTACIDDAWSSYWHNDFIYASSGLDRPGSRGFDVYMLLGMQGRLVDDQGNPTVTAQNANRPQVQQYKARKFRYQNPQTQDTFQAVGQGR